VPFDDQCYENYFYGQDLEVENGLGGIEDLAGPIINNLIETKEVPAHLSNEHQVLMAYTATQHGRTKHAGEANNAFSDYYHKLLLRNNPEFSDINLDNYVIADEYPANLPLECAAMMSPLLLDLRIKILHNCSSEQFITSDNPVIMYNQYMEHVTVASSNGFASVGLQIFFPLSPDTMLIMYDDSIYRIGGNQRDIIEIFSPEEVLRLNKLQLLNSLENVFFSKDTQTSSIELQADNSIRYRDDELAKIREYELKEPEPTYNSESILQVQKHQLRTGLKLDSVSIRKSKWKIPYEIRQEDVLKVRIPSLVRMFETFQVEVKAGNYGAGDFMEYLLMQTKQMPTTEKL